MKRTSKAFCLLFVVIMLFVLSITAFAGNETNDGNIKIEVATNKGSYGVTDIAEITATITNVSDKDINNVTAQAVFDDLAPAAKKKSQTSKSVDVLKSGESFSFKYKVTLNEDKHKINFFQKIILWFVRLFNGGYNANNNSIDVVTENVLEIKFGKFTTKNVVQVGYVVVENDNSDNTNDNNNTENDGNEDDNNSSLVQTELLNMAKLNGGKVPDITVNSGIPSFISGKFSDIKVIDIASAINSLKDIKNLMMIKEVENEFIEKSCSNTQYKLQQIYNNIPVYGCSITITTDGQGNIECLNGHYTPNLNINITPKISETEVIRLLTNEGYSAGESIELVIYAVSGYTPQLAYKIRCNGMVDIFVSAEDGHIISSRSNRTSFSSIGVDLSANIREFETYKKNNNMFLLKDDSRGIIIYSDENLTTPEELYQIKDYDEYLQHATIITSLDNLWNPKAVQAMYSAKNAYDFYRNTVITSAFDNNNLSTINFVIDYSQNYMNAFSDTDPCDLTTTYLCIGDGEDYLNAYDVIYHEFTHSVIASTCGLEYLNEAGAINEAYADILGNLIENKEDEGAWLIGEDMSTGAGRNLKSPSESKPTQPEHINDDNMHTLCFENHDHYKSNCDNGGVHSNSGIINKAAYLIWEYGFCDKKQLAQLFVTSLEYMDKNANFYDCRAAILHSAKVLNMSSEQIEIIKKSFDEVGIAVKGNILVTVTGTVTDEETGEPIPNASVIADSGQPEKHIAFTDENGRYELALPDTLCEFEFYHENFVEKKFSRHISADMQINVSLTPKSTIKNILLDNTWYNNIQDYCEYKFYEDGTVVENPDSDFSRTLTYSITNNVLNIYWDESEEPYTTSLKYVTKNDSYDWDKDLFFYNVIYNEIADDECFLYEYDYEPDEMGLENAMWLRCKNDTVEDNNTFTGIVLDEATEAPISNVVVNITEQGDSLNNILEMVITDENGEFSLNLPDGDYTLEFLHDNYEMDFAFITIGSDENNSSFYLTPLETRTLTASGNCGADGDNVTWTLYDDGELVISGSGEMEDYGRAKTPWYSLRSSITKATIEDGVTSVGNYSFFYCGMMNTATIADTVVRIGAYAFQYCENLLNIETPNSVIIIGQYAFYECKSLKTITINAVEKLNLDVIENCENLSEIKFGSNVKNIDTRYSFSGCSQLTKITVDNENLFYSSDETGVLFNKEKTILVRYPIGKTDKYYEIPNSVNTIDSYAFYSCNHLESLNIPETVKEIDNNAFQACTNLTSIALPEIITNIPEYAFYYCTSLKNITIPDCVVSIGKYAFTHCTSLTDIKLPDSLTRIEFGLLGECTSLKNIVIPCSVSNIDDCAFEACTSLESIIVDKNNKYYSNDECGVLFNKDKTNLLIYPMGNIRTSYIVPAGVTTIERNAFKKSKKLESINLPDSLTSICSGAFIESGLRSINIPDNVINIEGKVFKKCTRLVSVTIPNNITKIENGLFEGCIYLTNINLPNSITHIDNYAFADCTYLTSIKLPDSIISIGSYAFEDCRYLTNIRLSYNLTNIAQGAFSGCTNLKDVYYTGTQEQWEKINLDYNPNLTNATIHYNYNA